MIFIYAIDIADCCVTDDKIEYLKQYLHEVRIIQINRYQSAMDVKRSLFSELLLRYALRAEYDIYEDKLHFFYNSYGKPFLSNYPNIHFNISHSGKWCVCALSNEPIGIDVQKISEKSNSIMRTMCSEAEYAYLLKLNDKMRDFEFIRLWTLKESFSKCEGKGLYLPFELLSFNHDPDEVVLFVNGKRDNIHSFDNQLFDSEYYLSVCSIEKNDTLKSNVNLLKLEKLLESI